MVNIAGGLFNVSGVYYLSRIMLRRDIDRLREQWSASMDEFMRATLALDLLPDTPHDPSEFERLRGNWLTAASRQGAYDLTLWAAFDCARNRN